ncbi:MAG: hypothetical protein WBL67_15845 [Nitrososphaeraceae archaeon]
MLIYLGQLNLHISEIETEIEDNNDEYDSSNDASRESSDKGIDIKTREYCNCTSETNCAIISISKCNLSPYFQFKIPLGH